MYDDDDDDDSHDDGNDADGDKGGTSAPMRHCVNWILILLISDVSFKEFHIS